MVQQVEYSLPQWLQRELDQFGVFGPDTSVVTTKTRSTRYDSVGWMPAYRGEEPPY